jgi:hypothetical protein
MGVMRNSYILDAKPEGRRHLGVFFLFASIEGYCHDVGVNVDGVWMGE